MRYGREITVGDQIRLTEVVEIPASGQSDAAAWLAVHMPTLSPEGWIHVADDNQSGDVKNGSVYETPAVPPPAPEQIDQSSQARAMILGRARELDKKGKYNEASALRATLGE